MNMLQQQSKVKPQPGTPRTLFTRTPLSGIIGQDADKSAKEGKKMMMSRSEQLLQRLEEVSPPGFEGTVLAMKKHPEITNPWALSWWAKNRGEHSHYTKTGKKKRGE